MTSRVIQGSFLNGGVARAAANAAQWPKAAGARPAHPPLQARGAAPLQRSGGNAEAYPVNADVLRTAGPGQALPDAVRRSMETVLGANFSGVRVHVGPQAARIGAIAFTTGNDIYFAPGRYDPHSPQGHRLLGHELAHVVQQRQGRARNPFGTGTAVIHNHALEAEAEHAGQRAARAASTQQTALGARGVIQGMKRSRASFEITKTASKLFNKSMDLTQDDLAGDSKSAGRKTFYKQADAKSATNKGNYVKAQSAVYAFLKINGQYASFGKNNKADNSLEFEHIGYRNQKGLKDNLHAEDWCIQSFKEQVTLSGLDLDDFLKNKYPFSGIQTKHFFSIRINFSSCLGCTATIRNFKSWLDQELGANNFVLRVKFLRPYALSTSATSSTSDSAQNFTSSIGGLKESGIAVRMQPRHSAKDMETKKLKLTEPKKIAVEHSGVNNVLTDNEIKELNKTWTELGVNRK